MNTARNESARVELENIFKQSLCIVSEKLHRLCNVVGTELERHGDNNSNYYQYKSLVK